MNNTKIFDVLIVYSHKIAKSASLASYMGDVPFPINSSHANYNQTYEYLIEICEKNGLSAAFTTSEDVISAGTAKSYWLWQNKKWKRVIENCYSTLIFDKFFPRNKLKQEIRKMLLSDSVRAFSNTRLLNLFFDKLSTSRALSEFSSPTINIDGSDKESISKALSILRNLVSLHPNKGDFSEDLILKDRFGAGGDSVYKIESNYSNTISAIIKQNKHISFVLQAFLKFDKGFIFQNYPGQTEIRLIYKGSKLIQTYIRVSGDKDFLCNHGDLGGIEIAKKDIPDSVFAVANSIVEKINTKHAIYALDFIVSNKKNVYLLEGNSSPGIDWNSKYPKNERMNKKMIDIIVTELSRRVTDQKIALKN